MIGVGITEPGVYETVTPEQYHADVAAEPSLSASLAHAIVTSTPAHARLKSSRFNPKAQDAASAAFDIGTAAHMLMTGKGRDVEVIEAADWRTKAAKEQRDDARAQGRTPMLAEQYERTAGMVEIAREAMAGAIGHNPFNRLPTELAYFWRSDMDAMCRALADALDVENRLIWDYKTTGELAEPESWFKRALNNGIDIRAVHYIDGARRIFGGEWRYICVVQETAPPHFVSFVAPPASAIETGRRKHRRACVLWRRALAEGVWKAWPQRIVRPDLPPWYEAQWLEREVREEHGIDRDALARTLKTTRLWQAPL